MIIDYSIKNSNIEHLYHGLGFFATWNTRQALAVITFLGKAVVTDSAVGTSVVLDETVGVSTQLDESVGGATVVDKTDE